MAMKSQEASSHLTIGAIATNKTTVYESQANCKIITELYSYNVHGNIETYIFILL